MDAADYPYAALSDASQAERAAKLADEKGIAAGEQWALLSDACTARAITSLLVYLAALLFANHLLMPLGDTVRPGGPTELPLVALIGMVTAQTAVVPAVMVFGIGSVWIRGFLCLLLAYGLCAAWLAGLFIMAWQQSYPQPVQPHWYEIIEQIAWGVGLWIPAALIACQAPLWLLKVYFGWRLVHGDEAQRTAVRHVTIADYLRTMAVIGAALMLGRWHAVGQESEQLAILLLLFGGGGALACLLGVVPTMWLLLRLQSWRVGLAVLAAYCLVLSQLLLAIQIMTAGHAGWVGWYEWLLVATPLVTWGATLAAAAAIVRAAGYRLETGRPKRAALP